MESAGVAVVALAVHAVRRELEVWSIAIGLLGDGPHFTTMMRQPCILLPWLQESRGTGAAARVFSPMPALASSWKGCAT